MTFKIGGLNFTKFKSTYSEFSEDKVICFSLTFTYFDNTFQSTKIKDPFNYFFTFVMTILETKRYLAKQFVEYKWKEIHLFYQT